MSFYGDEEETRCSPSPDGWCGVHALCELSQARLAAALERLRADVASGDKEFEVNVSGLMEDNEKLRQRVRAAEAYIAFCDRYVGAMDDWTSDDYLEASKARAAWLAAKGGSDG